MSYDLEALAYHSSPIPGKIEVRSTKPCLTQRDLSLAYTPGVAVPCLKIKDNPEDVYQYTAKGNLVAVISNGTAVLGLGNIGALAGKPVMEGKGVLFKRFASVNVFDIELNTEDPEEVIRTCEILAPTFGGINLEDIKAPECFYIEEELKKRLDIPVFHDDQHGTAIISGAALLNAVEVSGKDIKKIKVVFNGAGAAGIACAKFYKALGVRHENITMCDTKGVLYKGREDLVEGHPRYNPFKAYFAAETDVRTLKDAMRGADAFCGVSTANVVTKDMVRSMAKNPIIFAMANPDPEITYDDAKAARDDVIIATGRSDYPNQVNNVLGFPFIFRGALDVRARAINEEMKIAASHALAALAKEDVPDVVLNAYGQEKIQFGTDYLIPKPFDPRVLTWEALAVAKAACESGVARHLITDWNAYRDHLEEMLGAERQTIRRLIHWAQKKPKRIVFAEGHDEKILRAANIILEEKFGIPILLGDQSVIHKKIEELSLPLNEVEIIEPKNSPLFADFVAKYHKRRCRRGVNLEEAALHIARPEYFGPMMVREGAGDVYIAGRNRYYPIAIRPMLQVLSGIQHKRTIAAVDIVIIEHKHYFMADTAVNINPSVERIVEITEDVHQLATRFGITPRIALLSFSNFGSVPHESSRKMREAVEILWQRHPDWAVDGEMQATTALIPEILSKQYPFAKIQGGANCLIFPDLNSANIAFKILHCLGGGTSIGPLLCGLELPMHVLQRDAGVNDIVNIASIGTVQAQ